MTTHIVFPDKAEYEARMIQAGLDPTLDFHATETLTLSVPGEWRRFTGWADDGSATFETVPGWHAIVLGELPYGWKQFVSDAEPPVKFLGVD